MSARRFAEWQAYANLEPFGPPAEFWQAGLIASMLANVNRAKKTDRAYTPEDFMPKELIAQPESDDLSDRAPELFRVYRDIQVARESRGRHGK